MNKKILGALISLTVAGAANSAMAADGEVNFIGNIVDNTCPVEVIDLNTGVTGGDVVLGDVPASALASAGQVAGGGRFGLTIDASAPGCNITGKKARVVFDSLSGTAGPMGQWLGLLPAAGVATNVGVQILDKDDTDLQLGIWSGEYADLSQPLEFRARYIATGTATAGPANAKASFTVQYN